MEPARPSLAHAGDDPRYACQTRLRAFGPVGQRRLAASRAVVVGVGATGGAIADALVRAGVGAVRLIDRDVLELSNLQRQVLYDEEDVARGLPKAEAARRRLERVNGSVAIEARVADLGPGNALGLLDGAGAVFDGTDNFQTRFLLNDACHALGVPWIYAGVVGTEVHGFPIVPGRTACFRCYLGAPPPPGSTETCETLGVLGAAVLVAGALAAAEGLKLLLGREDELAGGLFAIDVWTRDARRIAIPRDPDCPACAGRWEHLEGGQEPAELCGQDAVALRPPSRGELSARGDAGAPRLDLEALAARLAPLGEVEARNAFLLRFCPREAPGRTLTVFADGRALVKGTRDTMAARSLYARFVGG